jgi:hypothetical protein
LNDAKTKTVPQGCNTWVPRAASRGLLDWSRMSCAIAAARANATSTQQWQDLRRQCRITESKDLIEAARQKSLPVPVRHAATCALDCRNQGRGPRPRTPVAPERPREIRRPSATPSLPGPGPSASAVHLSPFRRTGAQGRQTPARIGRCDLRTGAKPAKGNAAGHACEPPTVDTPKRACTRFANGGRIDHPASPVTSWQAPRASGKQSRV